MTNGCYALARESATVLDGHPPQPNSRPGSGPAVLVPHGPPVDVQGGMGSIPVEKTDVSDLRRKLATLPTIEQAKGMLMGLLGCDADAAFAVLQRWSSHHNIKLRVLCADLVTAAAQPHPEPFGALRAFLLSHRVG